MDNTPFMLNNRTYNQAKFFVQIVLPAIGVLYASLALLWGFPMVEEVVGTVTAVALFLGVVLRISSKNYEIENANSIDKVPIAGNFNLLDLGDGKKTVNLSLDQDPDNFLDNEIILFRLSKQEVPNAVFDEPEEARE